MNRMAWRSLRHRMPGFTATFAVVFLSALVVGSFAGLLETATGPVSPADRETLVVMGTVIGGWGTLLALFAPVSTLGVAARRRRAEIGLLRTIGATPRQARSLVRRETLVVALVAAAAGCLLAWPGGAVLLAGLRDAGMVSEPVRFDGGILSLAAVGAAVVLVSLLAAGVSARRATEGGTRLALAEEVGSPRLSRWRSVGGLLVLLTGLGMAGTTLLVTGDSDDPYAAMQTSGSAGLVVAVGMAAFAPQILRAVTAALAPVLGRTGVAGHLASVTAHLRSHVLGSALGPVIVFTATATGILMLLGIEERTFVLPPGMSLVEARSIIVLNNVVVGMIALFCALVVVNALLALIGDRATELARLRLLGATPRQVRSAVLLESVVVATAGVLAGTAASLATVVPFSIARGEGVVPDGQLWLPAAVAAVAVLLTVGAALAGCRRILGAGRVLEVVAAA